MANELQKITFTSVDPATVLAIRAKGSTVSASISLPLSMATLQTAINTLPEYANSATVTGAITASNGLYSGVASVLFGNNSNVPELEVISGELHVLTLNNATGTKTIYGTVSLVVATATASSVQTDVRAKGGDYANVIVTKTGGTGTAVYKFSYPIDANPADLVIASSAVNEVQSLSAPGVPFVVLDAKGGTSQVINSTDTLSVKQTKLAANYGITNGHIVVVDSSASPTNVATGGTATAGPTGGSGQVPGNAFDGDTVTVWATNVGPSYIEYAYSTAKTAKFVTLVIFDNGSGNCIPNRIAFYGTNTATSGGDGSLNYTIEPTSSTSLGNFTSLGPLSAWTSLGGDRYSRTFTLTNNTAHSRLQIWTEFGGAGSIFLAEARVYETDPGGAASTTFTATFSGASVAGVNVPIMTSPTSGVTITVTQEGGLVTDSQLTAANYSPGNNGVYVLTVTAGGANTGRSYNVRTATGNEAIVDFGAPKSAGWMVGLSVFRYDDPTATLTATYKHSTTGAFGGEETVLATLSGITGVGSYRAVSTTNTDTVKRYVRVSYTVSGGTSPGYVVWPHIVLARTEVT